MIQYLTFSEGHNLIAEELRRGVLKVIGGTSSIPYEGFSEVLPSIVNEGSQFWSTLNYRFTYMQLPVSVQVC
jgi:hypothetical protein